MEINLCNDCLKLEMIYIQYPYKESSVMLQLRLAYIKAEFEQEEIEQDWFATG